MDKLSKRQGVILSAYTGVLCGPFSDFAEYAQEKLGRAIFTHQFPSLEGEIKEAATADFLDICAP